MATSTPCMGALVLGLAIVGLGCDDTRRDWSSCVDAGCASGYTCIQQRCVLRGDAGEDAALAALDAPAALDGPSAHLEAGPADAPASEASVDLAAAGGLEVGVDQASDVPATGALDAGGETAIDVSVDLSVDSRVPDAAGTCGNDGDCAGATPYCLAGLCVSCKTGEQCHPGAPICSATHACVSCAALDAACPAATPVCEPTSGRCVECVSSAGCPLAKPICDGATNTCVPCTRDAQCTGTGPGICMSHLDGHCAAEAETVFVGGPACSDVAANAGSAAVPFCSPQKAVLVAKARGKALMVLSGAIAGGFTEVALTTPLTVVGRDAVVRPADGADGIAVTAGELHLRNLTIGGNPAGKVGVRAQSGGNGPLLVTLDACTITGNPGGGMFLAGAAFDIRNTVITGNGPGETANGTTFGGIRVDGVATGAIARLDLVTISANDGPGLSCAAPIVGSGVLASGNGSPEVTASCAITPCTVAGPLCGAL